MMPGLAMVDCSLHAEGGRGSEIEKPQATVGPIPPGGYIAVHSRGHLVLGPGSRIRALDDGGFIIESFGLGGLEAASMIDYGREDMAVCRICGDEFPAVQLADHLRVIHPSLDIDIANAPIMDAIGEERDRGDPS